MSTTDTTDTPTGEARDRLHALWDSVAPAWARHADFVDRRGAGITTWMLDAVEPRPGDRVIELACGAGGVGLAAAALIAPGGHVVLSDVAPAMVAAAAARGASVGITGISTQVSDLEAIEAPDASFDVVLCRDGLQFAIDPTRALHEIARVLAPGGRVALAVWGSRARNPWLGLIFDAASAQLGMPIPPSGLPGPFSVDDPARLVRLVHDSGLGHVVIDELSVPLTPPSFDAWWSMTTSLAGPLAAILASLPDAIATEIKERVRVASAPYVTDLGLELPGLALLASAYKL